MQFVFTTALLVQEKKLIHHTLFTNEDPPLSPHDFKVFGSPVYVLDKALQTGSLGPGKWKE
jgi:hypothetical protein